MLSFVACHSTVRKALAFRQRFRLFFPEAEPQENAKETFGRKASLSALCGGKPLKIITPIRYLQFAISTIDQLGSYLIISTPFPNLCHN